MEIREINLYLQEMEKHLKSEKLSREDILAVTLRDICGASRELAQKLIDKDMTILPASIRYHGKYKGGLFYHSFYVAKELCLLTERMELTWQRDQSPYLIGILHDACKLEYYFNKGTTKNPVWTAQPRRKPTVYHGTKSLLVLQRLGVELTEEEELCIQHHMGAYEVSLWGEYDEAIKKFENVLWTHTADMYASKIIGV